MQITELDGSEVYQIIELYFKHNTEFLDMITIEDFTEEFCHRCNKCNRIICILDGCEECDEIEEETGFEEFYLNKEHYVYNLD